MKNVALEKIGKQLSEKVAEKQGWKKKVKKVFAGLFRTICYRLFVRGKCNLTNKSNDSRFGIDEFGRDVEEELLKYINNLQKRGLKLHTVLVLGSRAKGRWSPKSDVDVTIIAGNLPKKRRFFWLYRWLALSDRPLHVGIEASGCCSKEEFLSRLEDLDIQMLDAVYYGKILYDDSFWKEVEDKFKEIEEKNGLGKMNLKQKLFFS